MKTAILLTCMLLSSSILASAEQPELLSVTTRTSHWTFESSDQSDREPLHDFPIFRALGIRIDYTPEPPQERVNDTRIFSFYIAAAR
jgi:hypothetical protein